MENALEEYLKHVKNKIVKCAIILDNDINYNKGSDYSANIIAILKNNYTEDKYNKFLSKINFEYDNDFGSQNLFGFIWYADGTWSERKEYDGYEKWVHKTQPEIPKECTK